MFILHCAQRGAAHGSTRWILDTSREEFPAIGVDNECYASKVQVQIAQADTALHPSETLLKSTGSDQHTEYPLEREKMSVNHTDEKELTSNGLIKDYDSRARKQIISLKNGKSTWIGISQKPTGTQNKESLTLQIIKGL